jgi:hypothetical protein
MYSKQAESFATKSTRRAFASYVERVMGKNPVFVVGSGASAGAGISGMGKLAEWLKKQVDTTTFDPHEQRVWMSFMDLLDKRMGLEMALQEVSSVLTPKMTRSIVEEVWHCISRDEHPIYFKVAVGEDVNGFRRIFRRLKNTTVKQINIITPNYDRLIEWTASREGWSVWDGFDSGFFAPPLELTDYIARMRTCIQKRGKCQYEAIPQVRVFKPHGSLSWFRIATSGQIVSMPGVRHSDLPLLKMRNLFPLIVTPGKGKYLETHHTPYADAFMDMRHCIEQAAAIVFYGYGFNDEHLDGRLLAKLGDNQVEKVILALELSDSVRKMIADRTIKNYVAVERSKDQMDTFLFTDKPQLSNGLLGVPEVWSIKGMLAQAWGEE